MSSDISLGSDNVFADLGTPNPYEMLMKAELVRQINTIVGQRQLNQSQAAELLGVDETTMSALEKGKLTAFSIESLFRFLNILGCDVEIIVTQKLQQPVTEGISFIRRC